MFYVCFAMLFFITTALFDQRHRVTCLETALSTCLFHATDMYRVHIAGGFSCSCSFHPSILARLAVQVVWRHSFQMFSRNVQRLNTMYYNEGRECFTSTYLACLLGIPMSLHLCRMLRATLWPITALQRYMCTTLCSIHDSRP